MGTGSSPQLPAPGRARWPRVTLSSRAHPGPSPRGLETYSVRCPCQARVISQIAPGSTRFRRRAACSHCECPGGVTRVPSQTAASGRPLWPTPRLCRGFQAPGQTSENAAWSLCGFRVDLSAPAHFLTWDDTWVQSQENLCAQLPESCRSQRQAQCSSWCLSPAQRRAPRSSSFPFLFTKQLKRGVSLTPFS